MDRRSAAISQLPEDKTSQHSTLTLHVASPDDIIENTKRVFVEEENDALSRTVLETLLGLGERLEDVQRRTVENGASMTALQTYLKSVDERLSKLETSRSSPQTTVINNQASSPTSFSSNSSNRPVFSTISGQVEELGCMLDQLSKRVDCARDEAHQDKEELAQLFDETHKNLTLGLHADLRALKRTVGVGRGYLKGSENAGHSNSLAECLEVLAMGHQEILEYFKDTEATREDTSYLKLKQSLEELTNFVKSNTKAEKVTKDAAAMTEATDTIAVEKRDSIGPGGQRRVLVDTTVQDICPSSTSSADDINASSVSFGEAGDDVQRPGNIDLLQNPFTEDLRHLAVPKRVGVSGFPLQGPRIPRTESRITLPSGETLVLDATLQKAFKQSPSYSRTCLDPRVFLNCPPSSVSASRSTSTALKRKVDAAGIQQGGHTEYGSAKSHDLHTISDNSNIGEPSSLSFPKVGESALNPNRSRPLLVSASSEDDLYPSDEDDHTGNNANATDSLSGILPASGSTVLRRKSSGLSEACEPALKSAVINPMAASLSIRYWCPHECGRSYADRRDLRRHLIEGVGSCLTPQLRHWCPNDCGRSYANRKTVKHHLNKCPGKENDNPSVSVKRRKVAQGTDEASAWNSAGVKSGTLQKSNGSGGNYAHSREVLEKCKWPPKTMVNEVFDHQLLQCDRCDSYCHYRCAGVAEGDERLTPEGAFICPPCTYINDPQGPVKKYKVRRCRRPDCDWQREVEEEVCDDDSNYFVVERILGRRLVKRNGLPGLGKVYEWLVKWSGCPISESNWLEETSLPEADKLISKYYADAAAQGLSPRDDGKVYFLREARSKLHEALQKKWKWIMSER